MYEIVLFCWKICFYKRPFILQKRLHDDDDENSDNCRSIKRSKIVDENNKENDLIINRPSVMKCCRRGIGVCFSFDKFLLLLFNAL
jgi:hypothetical protein